MSIRLVASDLDGTLVRGDRTVSPRVRAALAAVAERGIPCIAVTARRWRRAQALIHDLALGPLAVVAGGTAVRAAATGELRDAAELAPAAVASAVAAVVAERLQPIVAIEGAERHLCGPASLDGPADALYLFGAGRDGAERRELAELALPAGRLLAMGELEAIEAARHACAGLAATLVIQDCIVQLAAGPRFHELHVAADDKGGGLARACRLLGVALEDTLALGDAPSDLSMLERAGIGVLMGQADPALHRDGQLLAPPVAEDGAAWALERLVLGRR